MKKVGSLVEQFLRRNNLWNGYLQYQLLQSWDEIVGRSLSEVTKAESLNYGILKIHVLDSVWAYHLTMMKPQLIEKINSYCGLKMVKDIQFKITDNGKIFKSSASDEEQKGR